MIRRYGLAVIGALLVAAIVSAIVRAVPWTQSIPDRLMEHGVGMHVVSEKLIAGFGMLVVAALGGFMARGERLGIIEPPVSDAISLFANERASRRASVEPPDVLNAGSSAQLPPR